jgi:hypothetical protein
MFRFDRSGNFNQLEDLDRLLAENSERILDQRHILSRLSDHSQKAELVRKFLEDLLSTQILYIEAREQLLVEIRD